ncbi:beta clamp domain-containing protein [Natrinema ejinorense]|uniref:DNA polymerase sliding clamp n=1 Tax=Natrinema ejinorense TaxID=373386 RepID=A0A2A5QP95_9EURY|nr:hypothetical protein [Natrinema ejinorense]PCR88652.1 hypothetical protein CP557_21715 [Natrinema ejinorense]
MSATKPLSRGLEMYQYRLEATVNTNALTRATGALGQFVDAYPLRFEADAIEATITDAAHVIAGGVSIPVEYETDHEAVTIAVEHSAFNRGVIELDDPETQTLTLRDGEDELTVSAASYIDYVPLRDRTSLRDMAAPDEPEYPTTVTAPASRFKAAVGGVAGPSSQPVRLSTTDDWVDVATRVDGDWYTFDLDGTATVDGPDVAACYASDYLTDIAAALSPRAEVTLRFGEDYPLRVETEHMWFVLAPNFKEADSE